MSTRSDIIVHRRDGKWARIYCHWDGYIKYNGRILFEHYNSQELAEKLVSLGDISTLAPNCDKPEGHHSFDKPVDGYTIYYGRDRGETNNEIKPKVSDSLAAAWPEAHTLTEYTYIWDGVKWWVADPDDGRQKLFDLGEALLGRAHPTPLIKAFPGFVLGRHT